MIASAEVERMLAEKDEAMKTLKRRLERELRRKETQITDMDVKRKNEQEESSRKEVRIINLEEELEESRRSSRPHSRNVYDVIYLK